MLSASVLIDEMPLIDRFKGFYGDICRMPLDQIESVYDQNIVFRDPVHEIRGVHNVHAYMTELCGNLSSGRFEYLDQSVGESVAYIKWNMHFSHPRLGNKPITVRGVTHIQFHHRIYFHEDVYDMGQMIYDNVPLLGSATRWLRQRLATAHVAGE